ncbi:reelin-like [Antedon mediterranea]|uniref:reelin-like n=1 Tax=Antedon mediterranea TaxID=105859 RepID=UPI003AF7F666
MFYEICEGGAATRPSFATIDSAGVILRDDFEADPNSALDYIWSEVNGGEVDDTCGTIMHGKSMVFCKDHGPRELSTVHLNTSTASTLQFVIGVGTCRPGVNDYSITVSYAINDQRDWRIISRIPVPINTSEAIMHIIHLPKEARQDDICLRFNQDLAMDAVTYEGCWALDNVLVINAANPPRHLEANFDPVNPDDWLFLPNGVIKSECNSEGNALVFRGISESLTQSDDLTQSGSLTQFDVLTQSVTTRDLNLYVEGTEPILQQSFDYNFPDGWVVTGAEISNVCGRVYGAKAAVFNGPVNRSLCTPFMNATEVGNFRFYFTLGGGSCDPADSSDVSVSVFADVSGQVTSSVELSRLAHNTYKVPKLISVVVPPSVRTTSTRFCIAQQHHEGINRNVWAVDNIHLLPTEPSKVTHLLQFNVHAGCGELHDPSEIHVEFSTNHGLSWSYVRADCLPGRCYTEPSPDRSVFVSKDTEQTWKRITLPLPYAALTSSTRFRWKEVADNQGSNWAIDDVYIGATCPKMCSGHGKCSSTGQCQCDTNFAGTDCSAPLNRRLDSLEQYFNSVYRMGVTRYSGAVVGFECGLIGSGKALVFNQHGPRELVTVEMNSTDAHYLKFTVRVGSHSTVGTCNPPDHPTEGVLLHYSCNNGISWSFLKHVLYNENRTPRIELLHLPDSAKHLFCRFRWTQPRHSGQNLDVWAIDDISITSVLRNTINTDFSDNENVASALTFHLGQVKPVCDHDQALSFNGSSEAGGWRYVETQSIAIGATYMIQFELVVDCHKNRLIKNERKICLEFSTNHGLTWQLVTTECLPGQPGCDNYHSASCYDNTAFNEWTRVTIPLPPNMRSPSTRFRWRQQDFLQLDTWAIDNIYIGEQCPRMCSGHGTCDRGVCRCDGLYSGPFCTPSHQLQVSFDYNFEEEGSLKSDWYMINGGVISNGLNGPSCGIIASGQSIYFSQIGVRQLVSHDINTLSVDFVQFTIKLGGSTTNCHGVNRREEGVLLQYSNNGGINWELLLEIHYEEYKNAKFVHQPLPDKAKTVSSRFRWWQPVHSGAGQDQWALDDVYIGNDQGIQNNQNDQAMMSISNGEVETDYCSENVPALVFRGTEGDRSAVTTAVDIGTGDVIQFRIVVGCLSKFAYIAPVYLQYSHDNGMKWELVTPVCKPSDQGDGLCGKVASKGTQEGSIYHMGQFSMWHLIVIELPENVVGRKTQFRWHQDFDRNAPAFALREVYIGTPCPQNCKGHGVCTEQGCVCDIGYSGESCNPYTSILPGLNDPFDTHNHNFWDKTVGTELNQNCGQIKMGNSLYFGSHGPREAVTASVNTTTIKILQFYIRIGNADVGFKCNEPTSIDESVIVQYTNDNGIHWNTLRELNPFMLKDDPQQVTIELPQTAKTEDTKFRWWQPTSTLGGHSKRAQWALDNVLIGANDTKISGFQDDLNPKTDKWYMIMGGLSQVACHSDGLAQIFLGEKAVPRYAETWDFEVKESTFLQFDLLMGCNEQLTLPNDNDVRLEFSVNMGRTWSLVTQECLPPDMGCGQYKSASVYTAQLYKNWKRVTIELPKTALSPATRFRWSQPQFRSNRDNWALDNVYLGNGCPWVCSGHGKCDNGKCECDTGYGGKGCLPVKSLEKVLKDNFDKELQPSNWTEQHGFEINNTCGLLVSGNAAVFNKDGLRMLTTTDLNAWMMEYIQFTMRFGCVDDVKDALGSHSVLVQYSNNGGVDWKTIKEIYSRTPEGPKFYNFQLPADALHNGTRFRFWQPNHNGANKQMWALDDVVVGGNLQAPVVLSDDFQQSEHVSSNWLFHPGGSFSLPYCSSNNDKTDASSSAANAQSFSDRKALVFHRSEGERYAMTTDVHVNDFSLIQFEINIGCTSDSSEDDPVRLEYSRDHGTNWDLVRPNCYVTNFTSAACSRNLHMPSIYYSGESPDWQRISIRLLGLHICGSVRFRWVQGFYSRGAASPKPWGLDTVYIGHMCPCSGHGFCLDDVTCLCDEGYSGKQCQLTRKNPVFLTESFEGPLSKQKFIQWSSGERTEKCGILITGKSMHFPNNGRRILVTTDMDLTTATVVQFYIKLGCQLTTKGKADHPVLLQYSTDGGLSWILIEELRFNKKNNSVMYMALELPHKAKRNASRIRWWQPSTNGTFRQDWAIDQIYIGGHIHGKRSLTEDFQYGVQNDDNGLPVETDPNWMISPGSSREYVCGSERRVLSFADNTLKRYTITSDVLVNELTYLQFELAMGCDETQHCYSINLEFSIDMGKTWNLLQKECMSNQVDCVKYQQGTIYTADEYYGWNRIVIHLPAHSRSKSTRFRWLQPGGFSTGESWALGYVYIGPDCPNMCSGHGTCNIASCICDDGWKGKQCNAPKSALPTQLRETFSDETYLKTNWLKINGAQVDNECGPVASGQSLHFVKACIRQLVTNDLDLVQAEHVQFYFKYGCLSRPSIRDQGVLVEYSTNGGIGWNPLMELLYDQYKYPTFVSIPLVSEAKFNGTRIRWHQPKHEGHGQTDWVIDNIFIGGSNVLPSSHVDNFEEGVVSKQWLFHGNTMLAPYCVADWLVNPISDGRPNSWSLIGGVNPLHNTLITTTDIHLQKGSVLEFKLSVGCDASWDSVMTPIDLLYSTDYGITWQHLVRNCLPSHPECNGEVTPSSTYYANPGWRRVVIPIPDRAITRATRIRWAQQHFFTNNTINQQWALDDVRIGPSCYAMCSGHGSCHYPVCICDTGFYGSFCESSSTLKTILKDRFQRHQIDYDNWAFIQGGRTIASQHKSCGILSEGRSLYFNQPVLRLAETIDLDLRNARFLKYYAMIGSEFSTPHCLTPQSRHDSVILQYSINSGITWQLLHELDYNNYQVPRQDYIPLPVSARTRSTRFRWWAPMSPATPQPQWALDDVYIGGSEINNINLFADFNDNTIEETKWDFYPYGQLRAGVCGNFGNSIGWDHISADDRHVSLTTRQLIVDAEYMIQFKIAVGCSSQSNSCQTTYPVLLLFNTDPSHPNWQLVERQCLPGSANPLCPPSQYHPGSVYSANDHKQWTMVTLKLPAETVSSTTQFRWIQLSGNSRRRAPRWSLDDIYIGEACPSLCHGHGTCLPEGFCVCDEGYGDESCTPIKILQQDFLDNFEGSLLASRWSRVRGGRLGVGCGSLVPHAHGKSLYFSSCGLREAITVEYDTRNTREIIFVIQIGSARPSPSCNIHQASGATTNKSVLFQYTNDNGTNWNVIAEHHPQSYNRATKVKYELPIQAKANGVRFRWWQPFHMGAGYDQWAIDHVELVL